MIAATLVLLLAAAPKLELGGFVGQGRVLGDGDAADGRASEAVDAVRDPWTAGGWLAWQLRRGHQLGLRMQAWKAEHDAVAMDDFGGGSETIDIGAVGPEYSRILPWGRANQLRLGGGFGFAEAEDRYESAWGTVTASGEGTAGWLRGGVASPLGRSAAIHVDFECSWATFPKMKSKNDEFESYASSFLTLQAMLGLSFGL